MAAIAEYRAAIRLRPDDTGAHYDLGLALLGRGEAAAAIAEFRAALRLDPGDAEAHCNLGQALRGRGEYAEALAELRTGHELGSKRPDWRYPSAQWVRDAERAVALAGRLPAILRGEDRPKDNAERLALARIGHDTRRFAAAARLWGEALDADPTLADDRRAGHRYNAARAAVLAGCGNGKDDPSPVDAEKAKLRSRALGWLQAELAAWAKLLDVGDWRAGAAVRQTLRHWKADPDLAGVRDAKALEALPEAESVAWRALWADVDRRLGGSVTAP
jgi:tetratricopeptide (TPR) repeat protein